MKFYGVTYDDTRTINLSIYLTTEGSTIRSHSKEFTKTSTDSRQFGNFTCESARGRSREVNTDSVNGRDPRENNGNTKANTCVRKQNNPFNRYEQCTFSQNLNPMSLQHSKTCEMQTPCSTVSFTKVQRSPTSENRNVSLSSFTSTQLPLNEQESISPVSYASSECSPIDKHSYSYLPESNSVLQCFPVSKQGHFHPAVSHKFHPYYQVCKQGNTSPVSCKFPGCSTVDEQKDPYPPASCNSYLSSPVDTLVHTHPLASYKPSQLFPVGKKVQSYPLVVDKYSPCGINGCTYPLGSYESSQSLANEQVLKNPPILYTSSLRPSTNENLQTLPVMPTSSLRPSVHKEHGAFPPSFTSFQHPLSHGELQPSRVSSTPRQLSLTITFNSK
ncbi:uncharacterized protein [Palaemon carinicauda]